MQLPFPTSLGVLAPTAAPAYLEVPVKQALEWQKLVVHLPGPLAGLQGNPCLPLPGAELEPLPAAFGFLETETPGRRPCPEPAPGAQGGQSLLHPCPPAGAACQPPKLPEASQRCSEEAAGATSGREQMRTPGRECVGASLPTLALVWLHPVCCNLEFSFPAPPALSQGHTTEGMWLGQRLTAVSREMRCAGAGEGIASDQPWAGCEATPGQVSARALAWAGWVGGWSRLP